METVRRLLYVYKAHPVLEATREECDGREYRLTYDLRPYESLIVELP